MTPTRRLSLVTGVLFLVTFVSAITGVAFYGPVLNDPSFVTGGGEPVLGLDPAHAVVVGAVLEIVLVIANLGTALALYPVLRRRSVALALGYVVARIMECTLIAAGILSLLTVVTLRDQAAGATADDPALLTIGATLVALRDWTFLLGPGFVVGIGNGLLLGHLMFATRLVPRPMALLGVIGGPLLSLSGIAVMFGAYEQLSLWSGLATVLEIAWEASLGVYLVVRGFRPAAVEALIPSGDPELGTDRTARSYRSGIEMRQTRAAR